LLLLPELIPAKPGDAVALIYRVVQEQRFMVANPAERQAVHQPVAERIDFVLGAGLWNARASVAARKGVLRHGQRNRGGEFRLPLLAVQVATKANMLSVVLVGPAAELDEIVRFAWRRRRGPVMVGRQQTEVRRRALAHAKRASTPACISWPLNAHTMGPK
jgi:hypothetical protein